MADQDSNDLVLRVREIDNGFLLLGRAAGERLPTKFFADLDAVQDALCGHLWKTFEDPHPEDSEETEDEDE